MFTKTKCVSLFKTLATFLLCMLGAPVKFWVLAAVHFAVYGYGMHVTASFLRPSVNEQMVLQLLHTAGCLWLITGVSWGVIAFLANKDTLLAKTEVLAKNYNVADAQLNEEC